MLRQIQFLSHQAKIATKIELFVYVPSSPQSISPDQIPALTFKRIGYLSLDSNERTGFTARELKSVYIQEQAYLLKISLHKCHVNRLNIFSQVGLIAINCHGEPLNFSSNPPPLPNTTSKVNEYDNTTAEKLRALDEAKKRAVDEENFDEAKRIKNMIDGLKAVSSKLAELETKKRQAIEDEDYELAKLIKLEIDKMRSAAVQEKRGSPKRPKNLYGVEDRKNPEIPYMETKAVIEAMKREEQKKGNNYEAEENHSQSITIEALNKKKTAQPQEYPEENIKEDDSKNKAVAEPLTEQAKKIAEPYYGLIDMKLLQKLFSKNWLLRESGLNDISHELSTKEFSLITMNDDEQIMVTLVGFIGYMINDKVTQVSLRAMTLMDELGLFYPSKVMNYKSLYNVNINECMNSLMEKIGDGNPKVRAKAEELCLNLTIEDKIPLTTFVMHCIKVNKKTVSAKTLQGKLGLLVTLFKHTGSVAKTLISQSLIEFALNGVKNSNGDVRNAGYALLIEIYKHIGSKIDTHLEGLRAAQIEVLKAEFAKVGEAYEPAEIKGGLRNETPAIHKGREEEELPSSLINPQDQYESCEYCGKRDPNFNADTLDMHMFDECPMLYMCPICKNIIEIINNNHHLLTECSDKDDYIECKQCHEAVLKTKLEAHEAEGFCRPIKPNTMRCSLCHMDITPRSIEMWRNHILVDQCPNNERKAI